ncbi:MAG: helix-turn-helix domain-containing protein [Planctomycetota bacterium]|jgi:AraC-like DNA-binding protein
MQSPLVVYDFRRPEVFEALMAPTHGVLRVRSLTSPREPWWMRLALARLPRCAIFEVRFPATSIAIPEAVEFCGIEVPISGRFRAGDARLRGPDVEGDTANVFSRDRPYRFRCDSEVTDLVVNFWPALLEDRARLGPDEPALRPDGLPRRARLDTPAGRSFRRFLGMTWSELIDGGSMFSSRIATLETEDLLLSLFVDLVRNGRGADRSQANDHRAKLAVDRAEAFIDARIEEPILVSELARVAGASERTLRRAFRARHGTGPKAYIARRRLDRARGRLLAADPEETTVTAVAMSLGFHHLGQFAVDYRRAFGERPSETLRR